MPRIGGVWTENPVVAEIGATRFTDGFGIVIVPLRFREQEYLFGRVRRAVLDTFRHRRLLDPRDARTQEPAVGLKRECHAPGQTHQVAIFQTPAVGDFAVSLLNQSFGVSHDGVGAAIACSPIAGIAIADIQPQCSVVAQDTAYFPKDGNEVIDIVLRSRFGSDLVWMVVVSQSPIGGRSHTTLELLRFQRRQDFQTVAREDADSVRSILILRHTAHQFGWGLSGVSIADCC